MKLIFSTITLLGTMFMSCNSLTTHSKSINKFFWHIAAVLPNNSDGSPSIGIAGPVAGVSNEILLIGGGSNFMGGAPWGGGKKKYYKDLFIYKKQNDSLVLVKQDLQLPYDVAYPANCSTDKGIVVAGGQNDTGVLNKVMLLNWDVTKQNISVAYLPDLPQPLTGCTMTVNNDTLYLAGGQTATSTSDKVYRLSLIDTIKGWQVLTTLPKAVAFSQIYFQSDGKDSCLYIVGGRKMNVDSTSDLYSDVYRYDLNAKEWNKEKALPYALSAHSGISYGEHSILVFSGDKGGTFHKTELLLMQIAKEKDAVKKQQLIKEKNELQEAHPGFAADVLAYNTLKNEWQKVDSIPFVGQVTTTAVKWGSDIVIPCGEIRAGVRTPNIIIGIKKSQ